MLAWVVVEMRRSKLYTTSVGVFCYCGWGMRTFLYSVLSESLRVESWSRASFIVPAKVVVAFPLETGSKVTLYLLPVATSFGCM